MSDRSEPARIAANLVALGEKWADADAAASLLEETRKSVLAQLVTEAGDMPFNRAENYALAHPLYREHLADQVEARRLAIKTRVRYDAARTEADMMRTAEATRRAELTLR